MTQARSTGEEVDHKLKSRSQYSVYTWVVERLRLYVRRFGHRMLSDRGQLDDVYVSFDEARRLFAGEWPRLDLTADLGFDRESLQPKSLGAIVEGTPFAIVRDRFHLSERELALFIGAAAPALSVDLARLYAFAWADFTRKTCSVGFLAELMAAAPGDIDAGIEAFETDGALIRSVLVEFVETEPSRNLPLLQRSVKVADSIVRFLRRRTSEPRSTISSGPRPDDPAPTALHVDELTMDGVRTGLDAVLAHPSWARLVLVGPRHSGRRTVFTELAAARGLSVRVLEIPQTGDDQAMVDEVRAVMRDVQLGRGALLVRLDGWPRSEPSLRKRLAALIGALFSGPGVIALTVETPVAEGGDQRRFITVPFPALDSVSQRAIWLRALTPTLVDEFDMSVDAGDVRASLAGELTRRFDLTPGQIYRAAHRADSELRLKSSGEPPIVHLTRAIRRQVEHALLELAERYETTLGWDDVVLPEDVMETLREVLAQARYRNFVLDEWSFRRKFAYGRGLSCLFSGPPGTGKTMMAGIIAREIQRDLFRVDTSRLVSKWIGETEKNLARVFDEAERAQAILLFDEADSLFAKRTDIKGSNDRFANMEVNYLLQRMERYDGISILTTNFERSLDEALQRRLRFRIHFPMPSADERALLWRVMLPDAAPVVDEIDYARLGKRFDFSGGAIKNAVFRAAIFAAESDTPIDAKHLERAANAEKREMGKL